MDSPVDADAATPELLEVAVALARGAGAVVRERSDEVRGPAGAAAAAAVSSKSTPTDLVTEVDRATERWLLDRLADLRPDDAVLGEEGGATEGSSGVRWVVDPIDGTVNYLYGIADHAVSIAAQVDDRSVVGVVHAPALGTTYTAVRGRGSWRDGRPLHVTEQAPATATSLVSTGFAYRPEVRARQGRAVAALLPQVRDIRRRGSCALDLCGLAAGETDAYVEEGPHLWDHAAGGLVATEAGARLEVWPAPGGEELVVAAHAGLFEEFASLVRSCGFGLAGGG